MLYVIVVKENIFIFLSNYYFIIFAVAKITEINILERFPNSVNLFTQIRNR